MEMSLFLLLCNHYNVVKFIRFIKDKCVANCMSGENKYKVNSAEELVQKVDESVCKASETGITQGLKQEVGNYIATHANHPFWIEALDYICSDKYNGNTTPNTLKQIFRGVITGHTLGWSKLEEEITGQNTPAIIPKSNVPTYSQGNNSHYNTTSSGKSASTKSYMKRDMPFDMTSPENVSRMGLRYARAETSLGSVLDIRP